MLFILESRWNLLVALWAPKDASLLNRRKLRLDLNWWIQHFASSFLGKLHQNNTLHNFHLKLLDKWYSEGRGSPWRPWRTTNDADSLNKGKNTHVFILICRNLTFILLEGQTLFYTHLLNLNFFFSHLLVLYFEDGCRLQEVLCAILLLLLLWGWWWWGRKETFT